MPETSTQVAEASVLAEAQAAEEQKQAEPGREGAAEANAEVREPDYKAIAAEMETKLAEATKRTAALEQTAKTAQGDQASARRDANKLAAEVRELRRLVEVNQAGLTHELAGDATAAAEARQKVKDSHARNDFSSNQKEMLDAFRAAGVSGESWETPEFEDARDAWGSGNYQLAVRLAGKVLGGMKPQKVELQPGTDAKPEVASSARPVSEKPSAKPIPNMDTGRGVGAGAESLQSLVDRAAKGAVLSTAELAKVRKAMSEQDIYPQ